ncbi:hypothetical protein [Luteipulveratus mongoliensis]|uniref:Uncharacterized protein n=1 Tax=Luteipulveratus mongoliensis TaxID=571913 RepID=A0A0K1JKN8_9MICO|nr:hypothetical protein [Luteipulveratus mongoliensis]AKU17145.1 hypothetical protein VV02_16925 [Luteipulveratus mongoliensis]
MIVDCQTCPVRGTRCEDCMVTAMLTISVHDLPLDPAEREALTMLVSSGLVSATEAHQATARREAWPGLASVG